MNAVSSATAGLQAASTRFEGAAAQIAGGSGGGDLVTAVAETLAAETNMSINVAVLRSAFDTQRQVLDILV